MARGIILWRNPNDFRKRGESRITPSIDGFGEFSLQPRSVKNRTPSPTSFHIRFRHRNHRVATTPHAIQVIKAEGDFGDKVAIAGFSVGNFGVFASSENGIGLSATGFVLAAEFEGSIRVTGDCNVLGDVTLVGADFAEDFDIAGSEDANPGMVMVLDDSGGVRRSDAAYDRRVAGVVSGAGEYKPAVILDRHRSGRNRTPLALMGKVTCWVDATSAPIAIGDMLTTSTTPGHAMKAADPSRAFGAVIGKALRPLPAGRGLVPILVTLQ